MPSFKLKATETQDENLLLHLFMHDEECQLLVSCVNAILALLQEMKLTDQVGEEYVQGVISFLNNPVEHRPVLMHTLLVALFALEPMQKHFREHCPPGWFDAFLAYYGKHLTLFNRGLPVEEPTPEEAAAFEKETRDLKQKKMDGLAGMLGTKPRGRGRGRGRARGRGRGRATGISRGRGRGRGRGKTQEPGKESMVVETPDVDPKDEKKEPQVAAPPPPPPPLPSSATLGKAGIRQVPLRTRAELGFIDLADFVDAMSFAYTTGLHLPNEGHVITDKIPPSLTSAPRPEQGSTAMAAIEAATIVTPVAKAGKRTTGFDA